MAKILWNKAIQKALQMYAHKERYCYLYGAKGQVVTDELIDSLAKAYPSQYRNLDLKALKAYSRGKIAYDCSGFTGLLTGDHTYSAAQWEHCTHKTTNLAAGEAGSILYRPGHIGYDIGYGAFIHIGAPFDTLRIQMISEYNWTGSGHAPGVDYTGADAR